ncbi:hypothetical protein WMY93_025738 [Mugilogobius chulae]|uniref:Protein kinase C and casein kinase substrate in neurons protein 2 n=1 Tax=Mugilogobius chulae TaxID=88201 RepID=A0AAW0N270_9GOBI
MSGSMDDSMIDVSSDSFWEVGNYKRTVKRVDDGHRLCSDLMTCLHERSRIEKSYAQQLTEWSKKWRQLIEKGPQYGTLERAWAALCTEAEKVSELHMEVKAALMGEDYEKLKNWQRDAYHKQMIGGFKETKEADDGFRKAQKPWAKKLKEVETMKKTYHSACKEEKLAASRETNSKLESNNNPRRRKNYKKSLRSVNRRHKRQRSAMKKLLLEVKQHLDLSTNHRFQTIYHTLEDTISATDAEDDLKWFRSNHGPGMPMNWPQFEDWSVDLNRTLSRRETKKKSSEGVTLTGISQTGSDQPVKTSSSHTMPTITEPVSTNPFDEDDDEEEEVQTTVNHNSVNKEEIKIASSTEKPPDWSDEDTSANPFSTNGNGNPFEDEPASPVISVPVRALYDYEGQEQDELSFKAGDEFTKIGEEDDQGWCKGRLKDGQMGLYPANYVEDIQ